MILETKRLKTNHDYLAPDTSEIRLLLHMRDGGLAHCTLPPNAISTTHFHKYVDEMWYFIQGHGKVWRREGEIGCGQELDAEPGVCLTISSGTHFQFRNIGHDPLVFLIVTMPPWPDADEAVKVEDHWKV
jgi:mannose-6-phosphate isomerase-like protein (cupin superfamily)